MQDNDEWIWNEWVANFEQAFADTPPPNKLTPISQLEMRSEEIDGYIVAFEHLRLKAGWEHGTHDTLEMFKKGLPEAPSLGNIAT